MNESSLHSGISRRRFLTATSLALAAPTIIPASALGRAGATAPSGRIVVGVLGWGMQGPGNTNELLGLNDVQVVAACDLDKNHSKLRSTRSTAITRTRTPSPTTITAN